MSAWSYCDFERMLETFSILLDKQTVKLKVRNTALGLYEGQRFDETSRSYVDVEQQSGSLSEPL